MAQINYRDEKINLFKSNYVNNNSLYVGMKTDDGEYYGDITVNLPNSGTLPLDCAFVDENNMPRIGETLVKAGLAQPIHQSACSGFCRYFAYRFNLSMIN